MIGPFLAIAISFWMPIAVPAQTVMVEMLGDDNYPPYSYIENDQPKGIYVDILKAAFERLPDFEISFKMLPWKRGLALIEAGEAVAIFPPYHRLAERPFMQPYSEPILLEQVAVFCDASVFGVERPVWPDDYYGLRIANNRGFLTPGAAFFDAVKDGIIELNEVASARHGLRMLIQRRVDCYINDAQAIRWELNRLAEAGEFDPAASTIVRGAAAAAEWGYVGYTRRGGGNFPFKETLILRLDRELLAMKQAGEIDRIVDRFFTK